MTFLRETFKKYKGSLRSYKLVYYLNNLLQRRKLRHNKELYKKHGIQKSIFSAIGHQDFTVKSQDFPWLNRPDALSAVQQHPDFKAFDEKTQAQILHFITHGYLILKGFYSATEMDLLATEVDNLLTKKKTDFNYTGKKIMDAFRFSPLIDQQYFRNPRLIKLLNFLMGKKVVPFQTINFIEGSEQRAHSDSIHMTTEPEGYLIASWTALEKTHAGNGPLFYYPKSHRLPFVSCQDYLSGHSTWQLGANSYKNYEDKIEAILETENFEKQYFYAEKGDVLLWHANLIHGGSPITQTGATRKSMVSHYFCEDVICYHEISQRPAILDLE